MPQNSPFTAAPPAARRPPAPAEARRFLPVFFGAVLLGFAALASAHLAL